MCNFGPCPKNSCTEQARSKSLNRDTVVFVVLRAAGLRSSILKLVGLVLSRSKRPSSSSGFSVKYSLNSSSDADITGKLLHLVA